MSSRATSVALIVALLAVAGYALLRSEAPAPRADVTIPPPPQPGTGGDMGMNVGNGGSTDPQGLPPGHPAMDPTGPQPGQMTMPPVDDTASVTWKTPATWTSMPNPSTMRLATFRIPRAAGVTDDADLAVTRAGGSTDANITRWIGQFSDHQPEKRTEKTVHGIKVTVVEVSGTFLAGGMMMGGGQAAPKTGWTLLAAIVEAPGTPYFFKLTGPAASVKGAHAAFDAMVDSITPSGDGG